MHSREKKNFRKDEVNSHTSNRYRSRRKRTYSRSDEECSRRSQSSSRSRHSRSSSKSDGSSSEKAIKSNIEPNYELSGNLDEYNHYFRGVKIIYNQPQDAEKPTTHWRIYPFKDEKMMKPWYIHRQSAYLIGRDRRVVDIPIDHPSCSKQHAVLQYRRVSIPNDIEGSFTIKPYLIDLDSINGTFLNNEKISPRRFYELLNKDVIRFAFSTREYVILCENFIDSPSNSE